jgi:dihydroxyacetone kinase-like protein
LTLNGRREARMFELTNSLEAASRGLARRGHCRLGDKTILDTLQPSADALRTALAGGASLKTGLESMRQAAHEGMISTIPLQARCGLAMRYGTRSIGHQDPGATSCYLIVNALTTAWKRRRS